MVLALRDKKRECRPVRFHSPKPALADETINRMIYSAVFSEPSDDIGRFVRDCAVEHLSPGGEVTDYLGEGAFWPYEPENALYDERLPNKVVDNSHRPDLHEVGESWYIFDTQVDSVADLVKDVAEDARKGSFFPPPRKIDRTTSAYTGRFGNEEDSVRTVLFDVKLYNASKSGRSHNGYSFLS